MQTQMPVIESKTNPLTGGSSTTGEGKAIKDTTFPSYYLVDTPAIIRLGVRRVPPFTHFGALP